MQCRGKERDGVIGQSTKDNAPQRRLRRWKEIKGNSLLKMKGEDLSIGENILSKATFFMQFRFAINGFVLVGLGFLFLMSDLSNDKEYSIQFAINWCTRSKDSTKRFQKCSLISRLSRKKKTCSHWSQNKEMRHRAQKICAIYN